MATLLGSRDRVLVHDVNAPLPDWLLDCTSVSAAGQRARSPVHSAPRAVISLVPPPPAAAASVLSSPGRPSAARGLAAASSHRLWRSTHRAWEGESR